MKWKSLLLVACFASVLILASPTGEKDENSVRPIHIIKPPVRCPDGMKPDANGRCRVVWERSADSQRLCLEPDDDGACRDAEQSLDCLEDECWKVKRDIEEKEYEGQVQNNKLIRKHKRLEALKSEKKAEKRSNFEDGKTSKQARSKHAFLIMLKKKKMQMMKPKPPPPHHPPHHHPPHQQETEEEPEEEPPEEEEQLAPERLFFGDEACPEEGNSTMICRSDAEIVENVEANKEFKEWKPEKSSESSESSDSSSSSSSSDSTGESESEGGSEESEDELVEKAIKIKLMKLFRMKQRYGPTFRRWLVNQLKEYENSLNY